jgi:hypothetical protein
MLNIAISPRGGAVIITLHCGFSPEYLHSFSIENSFSDAKAVLTDKLQRNLVRRVAAGDISKRSCVNKSRRLLDSPASPPSA